MPRRKKIDFKRLVELRQAEGLNQATYWRRYGITQSGGSRYENERSIPRPVGMLIWLHQAGKITDRDLQDALAETVGLGRNSQ